MTLAVAQLWGQLLVGHTPYPVPPASHLLTPTPRTATELAQTLIVAAAACGAYHTVRIECDFPAPLPPINRHLRIHASCLPIVPTTNIAPHASTPAEPPTPLLHGFHGS